MKLWPNFFELQGTGPAIRVLPAPPKPPPQPRVQVEGSSSSTTPECAPRALEMDARAVQAFPNEQRIRYSQTNPARVGTLRHGRFAAYKNATTIWGSKETRSDLSGYLYGHRKGCLGTTLRSRRHSSLIAILLESHEITHFDAICYSATAALPAPLACPTEEVSTLRCPSGNGQRLREES